ncbi:MAG: GGDEF domain-containing protein [Bacilli bacterium]
MKNVNKIFGTILNELSEMVIIRDKSGKILYSNNKDVNDLIFKENEIIIYKNKYYDCKKVVLKDEISNYELIILDDVTNYHKLIKKTNLDHLTNLYCSRVVDEKLNEWIKLGKSFSFIMGDLDNFKIINDTIGHFNADEILHEIGLIIKNHIKPSDLAFRFGGEEFIIALKDCSKENAFMVVERLRKKIEKINYHNAKVTMSFGIDYYDGTIDIEIIKRNADEALYESKECGKNTTTIYGKIKNNKS